MILTLVRVHSFVLTLMKFSLISYVHFCFEQSGNHLETGNASAIFQRRLNHWLFLIDLWPGLIFSLEGLLEYHKQCGSFQFSSVAQSCLFVTLWIAARQASLFITNSWSSLKLTSIESVMPSSHLILCCDLLLLPPIPPSIRVFSNESALHMRWPKYWTFSFSIIPSKDDHPGLISFRMDWLDLLAVQGTLKSLLQHYSSKASILRWSAFLIV